MNDSILQQKIAEFLKTGTHDEPPPTRPAALWLKEVEVEREAMRKALLSEVERFVPNGTSAKCPIPEEKLPEWARERLSPMARGLFPKSEQEPVLSLLSKSVVFVTEENLRRAILTHSWLHTSWVLANMYTRHHAGTVISDEAPSIVGLSAETSCFVSLHYFEETEPFADFVVHEAAHIFHNVKRKTIGLRSTKRREWLLPIKFQMRETFAYSCEAFSRIAEGGASKNERLKRFHRLKDAPPFSQESVHGDDYVDILAEASQSRNGWKVILERCSTQTKYALGQI